MTSQRNTLTEITVRISTGTGVETKTPLDAPPYDQRYVWAEVIPELTPGATATVWAMELDELDDKYEGVTEAKTKMCIRNAMSAYVDTLLE